MIPPIAVLLPILFLGGIVSTISGGGLGILLTIASTFFVDVRVSIVLVSLLGFIIQAAKIAHFSQHTRWNIVGWYLLLGVPMSFIGALFLFLLPVRVIEIALATLCIVYILVHVLHLRPKVQASITNLILLGGFNGLVGGVVGHGSLLRLPTLLAFGLTKEQFVATSSVIAFLMNAGKSVVYVQQFSWSQDAFILFLCAAPTVFVGVWIGKKLLKYVSPMVFENLLLGIVFLGAVRLLFFT
ncbi:MAG: sulfite exporter TauE/SafE family protein [Candidatus Peregrinibacteria bacterium]|nr:sulfite exporter TauE/SafE family protein [Candidatus Peregrinibacteria bacterium]